MRIVFRLFCLAVLLPGAALAETGGTFRDWTVVCSIGLDCTASVFAVGQKPITSLSFERTVEADARPSLLIGFAGDERITGPVSFAVDEEPQVVLAESDFVSDELGARAEGKEVEARLIPALRDGASVELRVETSAGEHVVSFSLAGLVAALRKIDDDQARVGTQTALIDKGEKPLPDRALLPADIAAAEDLPRAVRDLWTNGPGQCSDLGDNESRGGIGFSIPAGEGQRLFNLACGLPGAYNSPSRFYVLSGNDDPVADLVPVPGIGTEGPDATMTAWNVDYADDRFTSFFKGRGIGDCGQYFVWRYDPGSASLVLLEAREKPDCDGEAGDGPDGWPRLWPKS